MREIGISEGGRTPAMVEVARARMARMENCIFDGD